MDDPAFASKRIGRYELLSRLAVGGMAEIFLAVERGLAGLERTVVIKRILPQFAGEKSFVEMFLREARIIARLNHPNVVQIHELGELPEGGYFIAMEYIHGSDTRELSQLAEESGVPVPYDVIMGIVAQACRGLHAAHELKDPEGNFKGVIHRDITPQNLMVTEDGHVKLLDFGIAKAASGIDATYSGTLKGKFSYLSPEQCEGDPLDRRSDIFTLGVVFWELLVGDRLFKRDSELEMVAAVLDADIAAPSSLVTTLPAELDAVVYKALARDPDDRFQTAREMRKAIEQVATTLDLDIGPDRIARFTREVAKDQLAVRRSTLQNAKERTLVSVERRQIYPDYDTGPRERYAAEDNVAAPDSSDLPATRPTAQSTGLHVILPLLVLLAGAIALAVIVLSSSEPQVDSTSTAIEQNGEQLDEQVAPGEQLLVGWAPYVDPDLVLSEIEPFQRYLSSATERNVQFVVTESYADLAERLTAGEIDLAVLPPLLYIRTAWQHPDIELLAVKQYDGAETYDGWLVVPDGSPARQLLDVRGLRFCLTDENSASGFLLPRHFIRQNGFEPDAFIGEVHWSGHHLQALRDLLDGTCDVAATYNGAVFSADGEGISTGRIRLLAVTGLVPQDVVVAGAHLSSEDRERFGRVFLDFEPLRDTGMQRIGAVQRVTGFSPADDAAYDALRQAVRAEEGSAPRDDSSKE